MCGQMFGIVLEELANILNPDSLINLYADNARDMENAPATEGL